MDDHETEGATLNTYSVELLILCPLDNSSSPPILRMHGCSEPTLSEGLFLNKRSGNYPNFLGKSYHF